MKYDIESILEMYEDDYNPSAKVPGPRNMKLAEVPRSEMDNFNTPDLDQGADSILRPGETLEDDFDVTFRRPNAQGGVQQLVSNTVDGSRPGYSGDFTAKQKQKITEAFPDIELNFNKYGILTAKQLFKKEDMNRVKYSKKITKNEVSQKGFVDKFLSSVRQKMYGKKKF